MVDIARVFYLGNFISVTNVTEQYTRSSFIIIFVSDCLQIFRLMLSEFKRIN